MGLASTAVGNAFWKQMKIMSCYIAPFGKMNWKIASMILLAAAVLVESRGPQQVTCGSVIKLQNMYHKVRLHSHDVKYGSGSGQQSVTGTEVKEDVNSHWAIKGPSLKKQCSRGNPIECGQEIRFEHVTTN